MNDDKFDPIPRKRGDLIKTSEEQAKYDALKPQFDLIKQMVQARQQAGMSQQDLAKAMGVSQPSVARLESLTYSPTVKKLHQYAKAVGCEMKIEFMARK